MVEKDMHFHIYLLVDVEQILVIKAETGWWDR